METLLITQDINNRKKYDCEINYSKDCFIKWNVKEKYSLQMSSKIQFSETPHQAEKSQIIYIRNELTGSYITQVLTERITDQTIT